MGIHAHRVFSLLVAGVALVGSSACRYEEGLLIENMKGTVIVPREAATVTWVDGDGNENEVTDVRNIGPVYIGLFADIEEANVVANYPHPSVGPIFQDGIQGDTYPYGGTTMGDLRFGCFDALTCKMTSGRWESYDAIVEWFNDTLGIPIVDADGRKVENGEYFRQTCFDLMEVTSDLEVMLMPQDRNGDEKVNALDLDFVENADGDFEGTFTLWQQDFFWDQDAEEKSGCTPGLDCPAFKLWAFMDGPGGNDASFATCDNSDFVGFEVEEYNHDFFGGRAMENVLNQPDSYVGEGDWVANQFLDGNELVDGFYEWQNRFDRPTIRLGYEVTQ